MNPELLEMATFADGSGKHRNNLESAERTISEREAALKVLRAFIEKHGDTLAGMSWTVDMFGPEISLGSCYRYYRGKQVDCEFIALNRRRAMGFQSHSIRRKGWCDSARRRLLDLRRSAESPLRDET